MLLGRILFFIFLSSSSLGLVLDPWGVFFSWHETLQGPTTSPCALCPTTKRQSGVHQGPQIMSITAQTNFDCVVVKALFALILDCQKGNLVSDETWNSWTSCSSWWWPRMGKSSLWICCHKWPSGGRHSESGSPWKAYHSFLRTFYIQGPRNLFHIGSI